MSTSNAPDIGLDELRKARDLMRSSHWIVRVLDPRRPPLPQIRALQASLGRGHGGSAPIPPSRSLIADRLADHIRVVRNPKTDADRLAYSADILPKVNFGNAVLALANEACVLDPYSAPQELLRATGVMFAEETGGTIAAYLALRKIVDLAATDIDGAVTEEMIRELRITEYHKRVSARRHSFQMPGTGHFLVSP